MSKGYFTRYIFVLLLLVTSETFAQQSVSQLIALLESQPDKVKTKTFLQISKLYAENHPDSAVYFCSQGIKFAEKQNDLQGHAILLLELGRVNALQNNTELARQFDNEALSIFRRLRDTDGIAQAYSELGLLDGQEQNISSADLNLNNALKLYEAARDTIHILETFSSLGKVYEQKELNEKALSYYLRALEQYEQRKQKPLTYFTLLTRIAFLYSKKGDNRTALRYLEEGIHNSNNSALKEAQIGLLEEEGKIFETKGEKTNALSYYQQELESARKLNNFEAQAKALISIAAVLKSEDAVQSLKDLKEALQIAEKLQQPKLEAIIYEAIAVVYRQQKNYKEALKALDEHQILLDSLLESDTTKEAAVLDSSYKLEGSRKEIENLQVRNKTEQTELRVGLLILLAVVLALIFVWFYLRKTRRLNEKLKASNHVKDTLFSIVGHDLKGPAGSAVQLFTLMETGDFTEEETKIMLFELKKQTNASFELLNSLFEWGRTQLMGVEVQPAIFFAQPIVHNNVTLLRQQAELKNISIIDHTPANIQIFADSNHFDFVIRNLLSNAIKFTPEKGRIDIDVQVQKKQAIFSVKDTGIGISLSQQQGFLKSNMDVSFGTKGEKGTGLGLLLVKEFLKANNGRIWLESEEGKGTTFYFSLPKATEQAF